MDKVRFFETLADIVESNQTHVLSFELRKLSSADRRELETHLRSHAQELQKNNSIL